MKFLKIRSFPQIHNFLYVFSYKQQYDTVKNILNRVGNNPALPLTQPYDLRASHFISIIFKLKEVDKDTEAS